MIDLKKVDLQQVSTTLKVLSYAHKDNDRQFESLYNAARIVDAIESGELVPVVRCKGCGYSYQDERAKYMGKYWCGCHGQLRCPDDYCNEGYGKEASHD